MTTETGQVQPTNKVVCDSKNLHRQTKKVETATNMYPGRLVKKGTNDDDVVVGTSGGAVYGWIGYIDTSKKYRPATIGTIQTINDQIAVVNGDGIIILAWGLSGESITKGAALIAADGGYVQLYATGGSDDEIIATAEETVSVTDTTTRVLVRSRI